MYMREESNNSRGLQRNKKGQREEWKRNRKGESNHEKKKNYNATKSEKEGRNNIEGNIQSYYSDVLISCWVM